MIVLVLTLILIVVDALIKTLGLQPTLKRGVDTIQGRIQVSVGNHLKLIIQANAHMRPIPDPDMAGIDYEHRVER